MEHVCPGKRKTSETNEMMNRENKVLKQMRLKLKTQLKNSAQLKIYYLKLEEMKFDVFHFYGAMKIFIIFLLSDRSRICATFPSQNSDETHSNCWRKLPISSCELGCTSLSTDEAKLW